MSDDPAPGGRPITAEECDRRWAAWTPDQVAARLVDISVPWCIAAGWALDLFIGGIPRKHDDIEIAVPRAKFDEIAGAFRDYEWDVVGEGHVWAYADAGGHLEFHQTWMRNTATGRYPLDVFREPSDGDEWICRRHPSITMPYTDVIETGQAGIPYLIPEVALLFKARANRLKDHRDFARAPHAAFATLGTGSARVGASSRHSLGRADGGCQQLTARSARGRSQCQKREPKASNQQPRQHGAECRYAWRSRQARSAALLLLEPFFRLT
jgi:hypothetical protein